MRTDELVELIALDSVSEGRLAPRVLATGLGLLALSGAVVIGILGIRVDLMQAMVDPVTVMKWLIPLALMAVAGFGAIRLTHPERSMPITARVVIGGIVLAMIGWWAIRAFAVPPAQVMPRAVGDTALACLVSITVISTPALAGALSLLRRGASTSPVASGALAGLAVSGAATAIYALHCDEDAPLFFILWYGLGMGLVTAAGAVAGRRLLRW
ncbi:MAG: DUF1109 domain-containing protein [Paracoccus sp. (in: a-proteobacteria)]|uniref:DUF1109 domain-containing protein n=1 Tax=Paracoccus sp. TaxID=267 RepID=UPI003242692F